MSADTRPIGHELLDAGGGRRLERFGDRVVDRPAPSALADPILAPNQWADADLRFDRVDPADRRAAGAATGSGSWRGASLDPWTLTIDAVTLELRPTESGQVGLYPEHATFWPWLREQVAPDPAPMVLHLFASTGATTLALAAAGARVTHVDGARSAVAWARRNAALSGLADAPIRWIVDDALEFVRREARRGRRYDGFVLDPPSFGHGPGGRRWNLVDALPELLDACAAAAAADAWVLLTAHTAGLAEDDLGEAIWSAWDAARDVRIEAEPIVLDATSGARLPLGVAARMIRR